MKKMNMFNGLFAIVLTVLMLSGSVAGLTSDSANTIQANLGENVKLQVGQTLNVDGLDIYLDSISSSVVDSAIQIVDVYDTAALVLSLDNLDTVPAVKYNVKVGEPITYKGYVIELTDIAPKAIGIKVSRAPTAVAIGNTAGFNEVFKIKVGEEYTIGGALKLKLDYVLPPGALGGPGQGLAGVAVSEINTVADVAPTAMRFDSIPETKTFKDYSIILTDRGDGAAAFKVIWKADNSTGVPVQTVKFGEKFKGSVGSTFRVGETFDIRITKINNNPNTDVIPSASINVGYIKPVVSSNVALINDYVIVVNENKQLIYNHQITLLELDENTAVFVIDMKRPTVSTSIGSGISIVSTDSVVKATQLRVEPGAKNPDVRSASGVVRVGYDILKDGIDINMDSGNTVRIRTDSDKLETYLTDGNVTAKTRTTLKSNAEGMFVETDSVDIKLKILPATASARAQEVIAANFNNLTLEDLAGKIVYKGRSQKEFLVLGFIPVQGNVEVSVDAETGTVLDVKKPWYSAISG